MTALDAESTIYDAVDAIIEDTKFNGVDLLGFSVKSTVAVADDGGPIYLKTRWIQQYLTIMKQLEQKLLLI